MADEIARRRVMRKSDRQSADEMFRKFISKECLRKMRRRQVCPKAVAQ